MSRVARHDPVCPCVHHGLRTGFGIGIAVLVSLLLIVGAVGATP